MLVNTTSDGFTGAPFKVSLVNTDGTVPPIVPLIGPATSATASIGAATTLTVTVAVSQLLGFSFSQIVYCIV